MIKIRDWRAPLTHFSRDYMELLSYRRSSVYVHWRLHWILTLPERLWQHVLRCLWYERLSYQYECGYADGMREAFDNYETLRELDADERAALFARPSAQQDKK